MLMECPVCKRVQENMVGRPIRCLWCGQMLDPSSECQKVQFAEPERPRVKLEKAPRVNLRKELPEPAAEAEIALRKARLKEAIVKAGKRRRLLGAPPVAVKYENIPEPRGKRIARYLLTAMIIPGMFLMTAFGAFLSSSDSAVLSVLGGVGMFLGFLMVPLNAMSVVVIMELLNRKFPDMDPFCQVALLFLLFAVWAVLGVFAAVYGYLFGINL